MGRDSRATGGLNRVPPTAHTAQAYYRIREQNLETSNHGVNQTSRQSGPEAPATGRPEVCPTV